MCLLRYLYTFSKNDVILSVRKRYYALGLGLELGLRLVLALGLELRLRLGLAEISFRSMGFSRKKPVNSVYCNRSVYCHIEVYSYTFFIRTSKF